MEWADHGYRIPGSRLTSGLNKTPGWWIQGEKIAGRITRGSLQKKGITYGKSQGWLIIRSRTDRKGGDREYLRNIRIECPPCGVIKREHRHVPGYSCRSAGQVGLTFKRGGRCIIGSPGVTQRA